MDISILRQWAQFAVYKLGGRKDNWMPIAAQWIQKKGWQWWGNPQQPFNVGNFTNEDEELKLVDHATLEDGVMNYVHMILDSRWSNGILIYEKFLDAVRNGTSDDVLRALSNSPACAPRYPLVEFQRILGLLTGIIDTAPVAEWVTKMTPIKVVVHNQMMKAILINDEPYVIWTALDVLGTHVFCIMKVQGFAA